MFHLYVLFIFTVLKLHFFIGKNNTIKKIINISVIIFRILFVLGSKFYGNKTGKEKFIKKFQMY